LWRHFVFLFLGVLALLISNTATCLASRLARSLAFAATAVLCAVAKITSFDGLDMFHSDNLQKIDYRNYIIADKYCQYFK